MRLLVAGLFFLVACYSNIGLAEDAQKEQIEHNLQKMDPMVEVESISPSPLTGIYEVELKTGELLYADKQGKYILLGNLLQFNDDEGFVNLAAKKRAGIRQRQLKEVPSEEMVIYPAAGEQKAKIYVFTDVDCGYCRKLHQEVPKLNKMGIEVVYLAFPRQGPGTNTYRNMVSIWCAEQGKERRAAMDAAKGGGLIPMKKCDAPVMKQFELGQRMGVNGTPAIVFSTGQLIPGYAPAEQIAAMLDIK